MRRHDLLMTLVVLSGCVRLAQPAPPVRDYRLDYASPPVNGRPLPVILTVRRLRVASVYDRELIVYRDGPYTTGTYFYQHWSANPGSMVGDLLLRDFGASGVYGAVQDGPSPVPATVQLTGEIEEIEERLHQPGCSAHLQLRMLLLRLGDRRADPGLLSKTYTEDESSTCNDPLALAAAMSRALQRISAHLQQDVYDALAADLDARH